MLLLFDVLGWSVPEIAGLLDTSIAAVNSGLQRARAKLETQPAPRPTEEEERALVERSSRRGTESTSRASSSC
jgi:RNA polymerase sigma-70 factor, ECF subfamily